MKNRFLFYLLIVAVVAVAPVKQSMAQKNFTAEADEKFALNKYYDAIELYKKAYTKVKNKVEKNRILFQIGTCYYLINDMKNAGLNMKRVIKANYPEVEAYNIYAQSLKIQGNYEEALVAFNDLRQNTRMTNVLMRELNPASWPYRGLMHQHAIRLSLTRNSIQEMRISLLLISIRNTKPLCLQLHVKK